MKTILDDAIKASEQQHAVTRDHITTAMQDLKTSQHEKDRRHYSQQQRERFIGSLAYDGITERQNNISETHPTTFEWMFDEDLDRTRDAFQAWLKGNGAVFWINGKAGSGKSTLMKFLANHSKTRLLLNEQSSENQVIIVSYFFWLAGSSMQKSLKGLLCSLVYQILQGDPTILDRICLSGSKRYVSDWSEAELQDLFRTVVDNLSCSVCIFLDGLDEFNEDDDIETLLDLLENLAANNRLKFCLSSRPEIAFESRLSQHKQVQLQNLTHNDMELYIQDKLQKFHDRYTSIDKQEMERIVKAMTQKADGVFLWVHYVLSSVLRGMRNADDPSVLMQRIEDSPSAMKELYNQMWKRHNGDEQRYREEAAQLFSCVAKFSLSVFEMLVVLDKELQDGYSQGFTRNDAVNLAELCERLKTRILTRCAGLLEFKVMTDLHVDFAPYSDNNKTSSPVAECTLSDASEVCGDQGWISDPKEQIDERRKANSPLMIHGQTRIQFLHRTARDYVMDTKEGRDLVGETTFPRESKWHDVAIARLATVSQGLKALLEESVTQVIKDIAWSDCEHKVQLLQTFRQICERRIVPQCPDEYVGRPLFWGHPERMSFECTAAYLGCTEYIRECLDSHQIDVNPLQRGYLMNCAWRGFFDLHHVPDTLSCVALLSSRGADIMSSVEHLESVTNVASLIFSSILNATYRWHQHPRLIGPIAEMLKSLRPLLDPLKGQCAMYLHTWQTENNYSPHVTARFPPVDGHRKTEGFLRRLWFVQMSPLCLYSITMCTLTSHLPEFEHQE